MLPPKHCDEPARFVRGSCTTAFDTCQRFFFALVGAHRKFAAPTSNKEGFAAVNPASLLKTSSGTPNDEVSNRLGQLLYMLVINFALEAVMQLHRRTRSPEQSQGSACDGLTQYPCVDTLGSRNTTSPAVDGPFGDSEIRREPLERFPTGFAL